MCYNKIIITQRNPMKNYADFYAKITDPIRKNPRAVHSLRLINRLLTAVMYLVYPLLLIYLFLKQQSQLIPAIFIPGVSFILVSLMRKMINVPRPYEAWQINAKSPRLFSNDYQHGCFATKSDFRNSFPCFIASHRYLPCHWWSSLPA